MSQSLENRQKLMKTEQIKTWVDVLKSDKDRKHHEEVLLKCVFAPFLFGKSYLGDKWISWGVDTKLFRDLGQPKEILDKLEGLYFDILDTVSAANTLVCKKLKETKAVDITSILILSEKCNKCIHWREVLKAAEINDFFSKLKQQLEATTSERGDKIGMTLLLAIQQYAEYVVQSVVRKRNFQEEMDKLGTDDMKNFFRTKGNESFKVGLFNDALKHYTDAINADRFNYILYSNRAQTNLNLRKFQEALCDARRAVILKPDWPKGHYRYAQAFYELGKIDKAKEVNRNGLEICRQALPAVTSGNNPISYLEIQAAKFSEKENEEDEVPELVDASSSNSDSAESEEEEDPKFNKEKKEASKDQPPKEGFSAERQEIDVGVLQKILKHKQEEDEKARLKKEKKRERKVELKRQAAAEEEERKKQEEAGRKKNKEEREKRKEDDKIRKAEKKKREEEKLLAEKARQEKLAATRELENTMKQGSEALLDTRGRQAVTFYQKAQELVHQSSEQWGGLSEEDYVTFLYAWGMAGLESAIAKEVNDAVQRFDAMLSDHSHIHTPLAYYGLAFAYFKHCKFHEAFEPLDKCEQMARKLNYVSETWPGTTKSIKETTKGQMEIAVSNLRDRCKNPPTPDAICRHGDCPTSREIYLTDPEFKGYVNTSCTEHCMIDYHVSCWKKAKSDWEGLVHDKDVINRKCNTPDCLGEIITLTIYGSDGFPRVEAKSEKVKKEKEKVKAKGKSKSKQEKKKQKKQDAKKNLEKGQGDNGERLESVSSSQGDRVAEELMMPRRVERGDDDTISTTSSNDVKRQDGDTATVWSASLDGEDSHTRGFSSDIEDILDDDLPISIPDATYVLKRDDFGDNEAAAKKSKPSKTKTKKKKAKAAADLNIQLQFTDDGQRSLMTSEDVMSPEAKARSALYTTGTQENPFAMPQHLKEQATDFERSLPPVTFSQTIKGGQSFADMTKAVVAAETDEEKSQKIALLFHLSDLFEKLGPVLYSDPRLEMELDKLPEAPPVISRYGGLRKFLLQSSDFYVLEDHVSLAKDATKCQVMFTERNNKLKEAGLPPPPLSGIGVSALPQNVPPFPPLGGNRVTSISGHFANVASDTVTPKPSSIGGLDALDNFDIPSSTGMDDIDDVSLQSDIRKGKMAVVVEQGDSMWPKNQDIDQELDRVLASQQLDNAASLQSLKQGQPFSTTNGPGPYGLGVKSVSVDISSLPTYDSGLGSMQPNITTDNKKTLPNGNGTILNSGSMNSITSAGSSGKEKPAKGGGITSSVDLQSKTSAVSTVIGSKYVPKTDSLSSSDQKVVVRDVADGMDTNESVDKLSCDVVDKDDEDKTENKPPIIEVDIRDPGKSDPKLDVVNHLGENVKQHDKTDVSVVEYQKLMARYKIVHNACKNFQEKRKNMKSMLCQTVVISLRTSGMNTEPFMEFEELKVIKERLQGSMRDTMQKYYHLQTSTTTQLDTMKATMEKKDAKEKELANALAELRRLYETESNKWKQERARAVEDLKGRDLKIKELMGEKLTFQNQLTIKDHELKTLQSKIQIDSDLWVAGKMKLEDAIQMSERNQKLQLKRAMDGEIMVLQVRCKMDTRALETWLREADFHLNNFKIHLQRTPDNMKMKEGFSQWQNAVTENKQKLDLVKSQYEDQIREIHGGRQLSQLATIEVQQITKPGLPPLPPPGAFMGPRPGFIPQGGTSGVRPPSDASRPPLTPNPSPSPSSTSSPVHTNKPQQGPISVSVPVDEASSAPSVSKDVKESVGPAKATPAQVTVPLQEQAPWPPAASATPPQASPPGFPASNTAPSSMASNVSTTASGLGAVGSSRPQSVSGANATPGNNRPVKQTPATASGQIPSAALLSANLPQQPRTNFERILFPLQTLFPQHNQVQLTKAIKEVRQANSGSLSGLSVDEIIRRSASVLKHQPPMRQSGSAGSGGSATASKGGWQNNNNQQVPQGQRLVTGVMQGMAAQQGKFQWSSELGGSSAYGKGLLDDEEDPCVICHEEMTPESIKVLDCGHRFHAECIKQWLNEQSTCPNCRNYTLLPDEYPSLH